MTNLDASAPAREAKDDRNTCGACRRRQATRRVLIEAARVTGQETELHPTFKRTITRYQFIETAYVPLCQGCARNRWMADLLWLVAHVVLLILLPIFFDINKAGFLEGLLLVAALAWAMIGITIFAHLLLGASNTTSWERAAKRSLSRRYRTGLSGGEAGAPIQLFSAAETESLRARNAVFSDWTLGITILAVVGFAWLVIGVLNGLGLSTWH